MARDTATTTKTKETTDVQAEDVNVSVDTGDTVRVIQYGDKYGLFNPDGSMIKGDIESRHEANRMAAEMSQKASGKGKATAKSVEDDDGGR